jgi:hypothetical protein
VQEQARSLPQPHQLVQHAVLQSVWDEFLVGSFLDGLCVSNDDDVTLESRNRIRSSRAGARNKRPYSRRKLLYIPFEPPVSARFPMRRVTL